MIRITNRQMQQVTRKIGILVLILSLFIASAPMVVFADTTSTNQSTAYTSGSTSGGSNSASSATASAGTCVASTILNTVIKSAISSLVNNLKSKVVSKVKEGVTTAVTAVNSVTVNAPVTQAKQDTTNTNLDQVNVKLRLQNNATVGNADDTTGIFDSISWDSLAYCVVNSLIEYVAESTINWANSGFNGSPSFISNTDNFFEDLADKEAGNFISELSSATTGINLCSNFKVSISVGLSNYYSKSTYKKTSSCSLSKIVSNIDSFMDGNFSEGGWSGWFSMTQNSNNNSIGATINSTNALYERLTVKNNTAKLELGLNNGFLNYKKCTNPNDPKSCKTVTPGTVIQSSLEKSLNLPKDRLVLAQKFDQIIEAVVNNLIKVALNEVLTTSSGDTSSNSTSYTDYTSSVDTGTAATTNSTASTNSGSTATNNNTNTNVNTNINYTIIPGYSTSTNPYRNNATSTPGYNSTTTNPYSSSSPNTLP